MSTGTSFDGDVAVGGGMAVAGSALLNGNVVVKHNLKVEGWIEASNVRSIGIVSRWIFPTLAELQELYPEPEDGWYAWVGNSTTLTVYTGSSGSWVTTGASITMTVDLSNYVTTTALGQALIGYITDSMLATTLGNYVTSMALNTAISQNTANVLAAMGKAVGDTVRCKYTIAQAGQKMLCNSSDLLMMVIDGVAYNSGVVDITNTGEIEAAFIFKNQGVIPKEAFSGIADLVYAHIPSYVHKIHDSAFKDTGLLRLDCEGMTPPVLGEQVFPDMANKTLYVHDIASSQYEGEEVNWGGFGIINNYDELN